METSKNNGKANQKEAMQLCLSISRPQKSLPPLPPPTKKNNAQKTLPREELKLAAIAISLNVRLRSSDMPISMLERAFRYARSVLDASATPSSASHRPSPTLLARSLKKEFDSFYGPAWHCVVGKSFGSFVTHSPGGFVYFSLESFSFLLFKTEVHLVKE